MTIQRKDTKGMKQQVKIVIVGGGFAGVQLVRNLDPSLFDILLIDKLNHHQFQPLFYQVATSQIEPNSISFPLRKLFRNRKNTRIMLATVERIVPGANEVVTSEGAYGYDILILATGCRTNFFNNRELESRAYGLKTTYDAIRIRNGILGNFERMVTASEEERRFLGNIVIVGAGPTGVELAGSFAELKRNVLPKDYPQLDFSRVRIWLLDGSPHTLNGMSDMARNASARYLQEMGVDVKTGVFVKSYDGNEILLSNGDHLPTRQVIWTAGVTGNLVDGIRQDAVTTGNRLKVDRFNKVEGYDNIFAVGDIAFMATEKYPNGHPQVANVAINQARNLAATLRARTAGRDGKPYEYTNLGSMATIGRNKAVVDLPFFSFRGYFAWIVWMFLHLMLILSVRNKLIIFINWAWNYVTRDTSLRLILKEHDNVTK